MHIAAQEGLLPAFVYEGLRAPSNAGRECGNVSCLGGLKRMALGGLGPAWILAVVAVGASSMSPAQAAPSVASVVLELSMLKAELLTLRHAIEPRVASPYYVYLSIDEDLTLRRAQLDILGADGLARQTLSFVAPDGEALPRLTRIVAEPLALGAHPCHLTLTLVNEDGASQREWKCQIPPIVDDAVVEIHLEAAWLGGPKVQFRVWPGITNRSGSWGTNDDDANAFVAFLGVVTGLLDAFDSAVGPQREVAPDRLVHGEVTTPPDIRYDISVCRHNAWEGIYRLYRYRMSYPHAMRPGFWGAYARCALDAGIRSEAVYAFQQLQRRVPQSAQMFRSRLLLADYDYRRGDVAAALDWLSPPIARVPSELATEWRDLKSRLLLAQRRAPAAVTVLSHGRHLKVAGHWLELYPAASLHYAMQINYAYALVATVGRQPEALAVLNRVGLSPALNPVTTSLRARANAKLGWYFLAREFGATAVRIFHRIPLTGLYSGQALLGMGWAEYRNNKRPFPSS